MAARLSQADKDRLHKLHIDSRALLESVADRLPDERLARLRTLSDVGEWSLLVNGLCASLIKREIPVTPAERDALTAVLASFTAPHQRYKYLNDPEGTLAALNVVE